MNKKTKELNTYNNQLDQQIFDENQEVFTDMICYIRSADISEYDQEIVRQDLSEMIISAQERGEDMESVIGEDYKTFCDDIIASLPPKTVKQRIIDFFDILCGGLAVLLAINIVISDSTIRLIRDLLTGQTLNFNISFSIGRILSILLILLVAVVIVNVIMKNSFTIGGKKEYGKGKAFLAGAGIMAVFLVIAWFGKETLVSIHMFWACFLTFILYFIHKVLERI